MTSRRAMWQNVRAAFALLAVGVFMSSCGPAKTIDTSSANQASGTPHSTPTMTADATPTIAPTATPLPLTAVDWMNFTYQVGGKAITVHDGVANDAYGHPFFVVENPIFGDITGDGRVEAVIPTNIMGAAPRGYTFFVYTGTAADPQFVAELPLKTDPQPDIQNGDPKSVRVTPLHLTFSGYGFSPGVPQCCPDLNIKDTFTWQSNHFVLANQIVNHCKDYGVRPC